MTGKNWFKSHQTIAIMFYVYIQLWWFVMSLGKSYYSIDNIVIKSSRSMKCLCLLTLLYVHRREWPGLYDHICIFQKLAGCKSEHVEISLYFSNTEWLRHRLRFSINLNNRHYSSLSFKSMLKADLKAIAMIEKICYSYLPIFNFAAKLVDNSIYYLVFETWRAFLGHGIKIQLY